MVPSLIVDGARAAIEFYGKAFGATCTSAYEDDAEGSDKLHFADVVVPIGGNDFHVYIFDDFPEYNGGKPSHPGADGLNGTSCAVTLNLISAADVNTWHDRAVAAGATSLRPPADQPWGDRFAQIKDPFGHKWSICSFIEPTSSS